jgi:phosphotransferase system  glucose/maltose/N-acetylglucosamine-specific IIC component
MSEKKSGFGKGMGMAAALGGLALALGLKRKHDREDKSTTISGSSAYYSDYTSSSKFCHNNIFEGRC